MLLAPVILLLVQRAGRSSVQRWVASGRLAHSRIGAKVLIRPVDLEAFLLRHREAGHAAPPAARAPRSRRAQTVRRAGSGDGVPGGLLADPGLSVVAGGLGGVGERAQTVRISATGPEWRQRRCSAEPPIVR